MHLRFSLANHSAVRLDKFSIDVANLLSVNVFLNHIFFSCFMNNFKMSSTSLIEIKF